MRRILAGIVVSFAALTPITHGQQDSTVLEPGKVVERQLTHGQKHLYQIALTTDEYASVAVEQRGIDVIVRVLGADGSLIMRFQGELRREGSEQIELVADAAGTHVLSVEPAFAGAAAGSYAIRITARRAATDDDRSNQEMRTLLATSARLRSAGKLDEAQPLLERALAIGERVRGPDDPGVAVLVGELAAISLQRRDYAGAEGLYQRALAVTERKLGPDHPQTTDLMTQLGVVYNRAGQRPKAEKLLQQALDATERILGPHHHRLALCLLALANLRYEAADLEKAQELNLRALAIAEPIEGTEGRTVGNLLNNLGRIYMDKRDYDRARALYLRSLRIAEAQQGQESYDVAITLLNLGIIEREKRDYEKAEEYYLRALEIRQKAVGPDHPDMAANLTNLANIYKLKGDIQRSLDTHFRALDIWEKTSGPYIRGTLIALGNIARTYAAAGDIPRAVEFQKRVDTVIETQLALNLAIGSERQKLAYASTVSERTDRTISLNLNAAPGEVDARTLAALVVLQRKGRVLDAMTDTIGMLRKRAESPAEGDLLDKLSDTTARLARLTLNRPPGTQANDYPKAIKAAEEEKEKLEAQISARSAEFRAQSQAVTLKAVQAAIPPGAALIEFAVYRPFDPQAESNNDAYGNPRYAAYVIGRDMVSGKDLGPATAIDTAVEALRQALRNPARSDVKQLARALDERILQPVRAMLGSETRLLISPDGALNLIPFEALVDERRQYAVERYSISYLTSGRDLLRLRVPRASKSHPVVVSDPLFGEPAAESTGGGTQTPPTPVGRRRSVTTAENLSSVYFARLVGTAQEARAIKALFPDATVLSRQQATKSAVLSVSAPRILHIATHGFFLEDATSTTNPLLRSGLALSGANLQTASKSDGLLTALEASNLNLWGTRLVTLSACDTGVGEVRNGEGVYGLRRAFFLAGVETLLMSLWPVSDYLTREMMTAYYRGLRDGLGRGESLRQAQLAMLARKNREHPAHWAGFIQAGDWASLEGRRNLPQLLK